LRNINIVLLVAMVLCVVFPAGAEEGGGSVWTGSVLQVNDGAITTAGILEPLSDQLSKWANELDLQDYAEKALPLVSQVTLARLRDLVLYQYAMKEFSRNEGFDQALAGSIESQRKTIIADYGGSEAIAREALAKKGSSLEEQLDLFKHDFVVMSYQKIYFTPTQSITRRQMLQYYRTHKDEEFSQEAEIQFQLIDVPSSVENARVLAKDAFAKLESGADFGVVVGEYSQGIHKDEDGVWRAMKPGSLSKRYKPLAEALGSVAVGEYSDIIETEHHFFIVKLLKRQVAEVRPFAAVQFEIKNVIQRERWLKYRNKLQNELSERAVIGDVDFFVKQTTLAAYEQYRKKI